MSSLGQHIFQHQDTCANGVMVLASCTFFYFWYKYVYRVVNITYGYDIGVMVSNTTISMVHAIISGMLSIICMIDIIKTSNWMRTDASCNLVLSLSLGFFLYDSLVIFVQRKNVKLAYAFIVHHAAVSVIFVMSIHHGCTGYTMIASNTEVANVFVHARKLMHYQGVQRDNLFYMLNNVLAAATTITVRVIGLSFIIYRITFYETYIPVFLVEAAWMGVFIASGFTIVILNAILKDFTPRRLNQNGNLVKNN